jgi:hypothetical protein
MIEVGVLTMIDVEVIAVRMAITGVLIKVLGMKIRTEVVLEVILLVLTEIHVQIVQTAIIMSMVETQTETINSLDRSGNSYSRGDGYDRSSAFMEDTSLDLEN